LGKSRGKSPATGLEVFKTYKQRGEWVELLFLTRAAKRGYVVSKPWGDSARYDVGIEQDGRFKRVQVKSTDCREGNNYSCMLASSKLKAYTTKQIGLLCHLSAAGGHLVYLSGEEAHGAKRGCAQSAWRGERT
jgi:hypothetical protein